MYLVEYSKASATAVNADNVNSSLSINQSSAWEMNSYIDCQFNRSITNPPILGYYNYNGDFDRDGQWDILTNIPASNTASIALVGIPIYQAPQHVVVNIIMDTCV